MATMEVQSEVAGSGWKLVAEPGTALEAGEAILILESMKMEIPVEAPVAGKLLELCVAEEEPVEEGQVVAILER